METELRISLARRLEPWRVARRLVGELRRFAGRKGLVVAGLVLTGSALEGVGLLLLVPIIGVITQARSSPLAEPWFAALGVHALPGRLALLLIVFAGVMLLRGMVLFLRDVRLSALQSDFAAAQRRSVMEVLARSSWEQVSRLEHARVTNLLGSEIQRMGVCVTQLVQGTVSAVMLAVQTVLAFALAPALAGALACLLLPVAVVSVLGQSATHRRGGRLIHAGQAAMTSASRFLGGLKTAAAQGAQAPFLAEFSRAQTQLRNAAVEFAESQARKRMIFGSVSALLLAMTIFVGFVVFRVEPAALIATVVIFARMSGPALQVQQSMQGFFFGVPAFEAVAHLSDELARGTRPLPTCAQGPRPGGTITFHAVSYGHPGGGGVRSLDITIPQGAFVGITGPSGAGKTTLIDLLVGLLAPQDGEIRVGGVRLDGARIRAWQQGIAYVPQDGFLFHDTLRHNLTWHAPEVDAGAIWEALDLVGARDLVQRLPDGLDSTIGERGTLLSGGERQRLGLARALFARPHLLVLDEATNALDREAEAAVLGALARLPDRPTIVMVTHREGALATCDMHLRITAGRACGMTQGASLDFDRDGK